MDWALNAGQKFIAKKAVVPIRSDIANSDYVPQDPRFKVIADMMKIGKTPYSVAYTPLIADGQGPWVKVLGSIFDGKIKEAQRAAQKQALEIVKKQG